MTGEGQLVALLLSVAVGRILLDGVLQGLQWNSFYYLHGMPIFWTTVPVPGPRADLFRLDVDVAEQRLATVVREPSLYRFSETVVAFRCVGPWTVGNEPWPYCRGLIREGGPGQGLRVVGFVDWGWGSFVFLGALVVALQGGLALAIGVVGIAAFLALFRRPFHSVARILSEMTASNSGQGRSSPREPQEP